jgi:hypothetical protein
MIRRLAAAVLAEASKVAVKAAGLMLEDPRGQDAMARAVGAAQRGRQLVDRVQEDALHAVGLAAKADHQELRKQIARIKRKARELGERLEEEKAREAAAAAADGDAGAGTAARAEARTASGEEHASGAASRTHGAPASGGKARPHGRRGGPRSR